MASTVYPWDTAAKVKLTRILTGCRLGERDPVKYFTPEPGVNFFLLKLEEMGCVPLYSCEGHPDGFQIMFTGDYNVAYAIHEIGFLQVSLWWHRNVFIMKVPKTVTHGSDRIRREVLRFASVGWERAFGALQQPIWETPRYPFEITASFVREAYNLAVSKHIEDGVKEINAIFGDDDKPRTKRGIPLPNEAKIEA